MGDNHELWLRIPLHADLISSTEYKILVYISPISSPTYANRVSTHAVSGIHVVVPLDDAPPEEFVSIIDRAQSIPSNASIFKVGILYSTVEEDAALVGQLMLGPETVGYVETAIQTGRNKGALLEIKIEDTLDPNGTYGLLVFVAPAILPTYENQQSNQFEYGITVENPSKKEIDPPLVYQPGMSARSCASLDWSFQPSLSTGTVTRVCSESQINGICYNVNNQDLV